METLKLGSKGSQVKVLQGYLHLYEDGIFGKLTEEAVKDFQKENNLTIDGCVGPQTWAKLTPKVQTKRKINMVILHCSATPEGIDYSVDTIRKWHKAKGWSDIGYHWVIYRDGSIHQGRKEEVIGAHCENKNAHSIGICYIGGLDETGKKAKDTRTSAQKTTLVKKVKELMRAYNLNASQIHCHNEFAAKACPSFKIDSFRKEL